MSIVVVGTIGYDTVETRHGGVSEALGGSASFFALAARFFAPVSIVAAVGSDFREEHWRLFRERNIDVRGMVQIEGPTFRWHGRYHEDMNIRDTVSLALNVFDGFKPDLLPDQRQKLAAHRPGLPPRSFHHPSWQGGDGRPHRGRGRQDSTRRNGGRLGDGDETEDPVMTRIAGQ